MIRGDIERWKVELAAADRSRSRTLAEEIGKWIADGEDLIAELEHRHRGDEAATGSSTPGAPLTRHPGIDTLKTAGWI